MIRILLASFLLFPSLAWASCGTSIPIKDSTGATQNITTVQDSNGNCQSGVIVNNAAGPLVDGNSVAVELTGVTTTLLVSAASAQTPRILAYHIESDAAGGSYKFVQGTQSSTACDTSQTALTGVIPADNSAHSGSTHGDGTGTLIKASTTNVQICLVTAGSGVGFHGFVTYWRGP